MINHSFNHRGFVLLYALLVASIVLVIGLTMSNIIVKQLQISFISRELNSAYYASNAGRECVKYLQSAKTAYADIKDSLSGGGYSFTVTCDDSGFVVSASPSYLWDVDFGNEDMFGNDNKLKFEADIGLSAPRSICAAIQIGDGDPSTAQKISANNFDFIWSLGYNYDCDASFDRKVERILCQDFDLGASSGNDCKAEI